MLAKETKIPFDVALFSVSSNLGSAIPIDAGVIDEQVAIFQRYHRAGILPQVPDVRGGYDPLFNDAVATAARKPAPAGDRGAGPVEL